MTVCITSYIPKVREPSGYYTIREFDSLFNAPMKSANSKEGLPLRVGTYVQRVDEVPQCANNKTICVGGRYIIEEVITDETVRLRGHSGVWRSDTFIHQPWEAPGWSLK